MQQAIQVFAIINFLVIGVSHLIAPKAWARFFSWLHRKGEAGVFLLAFFTLWFGSLVVAFHNVWVWDVPVILTVFGWGQLLKAAIYFTFPGFGLKQMGRVTEQNAYLLQLGSPVILIAALLLAWNLWWRW